jgi:hypothetical protein
MPPLDLQQVMADALLPGIFEHLAVHRQGLLVALVLLLKELIFSLEHSNLISK